MADLVGAFISGAYNRQAQERSFEQQKELQANTQAYNTLMWNMSNEYNNPLNQMARFKAAGLNPNLMYGQMANTSSPISMGTPSSPSPAQMQAPSLLESAQIGLVRAQKDNIEADTEEKRSGAGEKKANAQLLTTKEMVEKADLDIRKRLADSNIQVNDETIKQIQQNIKLLVEQTDNIKVERAIKDIELKWQQATFDDRAELVKAEIRKANSEANLNNAQANRISTLLDQELANLQAEFNRIQADTALTEQQKDNLAQQKIIEAADNFYLRVATDMHNERTFWGDTRAVGAEFINMFLHIFKFGKI